MPPPVLGAMCWVSGTGADSPALSNVTRPTVVIGRTEVMRTGA